MAVTRGKAILLDLHVKLLRYRSDPKWFFASDTKATASCPALTSTIPLPIAKELNLLLPLLLELRFTRFLITCLLDPSDQKFFFRTIYH